MSQAEARVAVVAADLAAGERRASSLRCSGVTVHNCVVNVDDLATLSAGYDVVLLEVGHEPERFAALAAALGEDARMQGVPRVVAAEALTLDRLASLGTATIVRAHDEAEVAKAVNHFVAQARAVGDAMRAVVALKEELLEATENIEALGRASRTLLHDARVLCGVIVGYGANLRDDIAGPLEPVQRAHVAHILDAANDITSLFERFAGAVRPRVGKATSSSAPPPAARGPARRTLCNIGEFVYATVRLFDNVALHKGIVLHFEAPEPTSGWCDAMQMKQVVTNLVVNAIKFTPPGGVVNVSVRPTSLDGASGPAARRHAELVVSDTGPGIPEADRERVFARGVRLERDGGVAGSGIGLAVVREIVLRHGGNVRVDESPGGGASLVVALPLDMRSRRDRSVVLVEDAEGARRIVAALSANGARATQREAILAALETCAAVVVVSPDGLPLIEKEVREGEPAEAHSFASSLVHGGGQ